MSTVFSFFKRRAKTLLSLTAYAIVVSFCLYAYSFTRIEKRALATRFYYLVSPSTHLEVSTHQATLSGGAGYLLTHGGREYVAFAVYFAEQDGVKAQTALEKNGQQACLLEKPITTLYFKTEDEKRNVDAYVSALNSNYSCMQLLYAEITRLEQGATQESSKRILLEIGRVLDVLTTAYKNVFKSYSSVCAQVSKGLQDVCTKTIYAQDLRYVLCNWSDLPVKLCAEFSL